MSSTEQPATLRAPARLMADLVRAMRAAAEESRAAAVEALRAEAKSVIDGAGERSSDDASRLRNAADADVERIREWSEAEIARIQAETDERIAAREAALERDLAHHAGRSDVEAAAVNAAVATFEAQMDAFFSRLAAIDDPVEFAASASALPEAPSLDEVRLAAGVPALPGVPVSDAPVADHGSAEAWPAADAPPAADTPRGVDTPAADAPAANQDAASDADPRLAALGLARSGDLAAHAPGDQAGAQELPPIDELDGDDLSARLAGLVPDAPAATNSSTARAPAAVANKPEPEAEAPTDFTRVVVTGLVNVASIASFKRHLARVPGVTSVTVGSGPDAEFVFTAHHVPNVSLRDVVPALPGFAARVTGMTDGTFTVSARDPESDS